MNARTHSDLRPLISAPKPDGSTDAARDICYADGLQFFGATLKGLQSTEDFVSTYDVVYNHFIATQ